MKTYFGIIESDFDDVNTIQTLWSDKFEIKGWGKRYRVRILGLHSEDKNVLPSNDLPIAEVMYPVTAGTGHDACYQTDALRPGSTVILLEDENKRLFIIGCKGNNERTNLYRGEPLQGFVPYSLAYKGPTFNFSTFDNAFIESSSNAALLNSWANFYELSDGQRPSPLSTTSTCEKVPLGQIQIIIKNFIRDVTEARLWLQKQQNINSNVDYFNKTIDNNQLFSKITKPINQIFSYQQWLTTKIQNTAKEVSKFLKDVIVRIQTGATNLINDALKDFYYLLFPNQLQQFKERVETANDLIACLFRKVIRNLLRLTAKFLESAVNNIINPVSCAIENFIGGFFGKLIGLITNSIDAILQPLSAILGVFNIASDILSIVEDVLTTLSCDESPSCSKIQEWSLWEGQESVFIESSNLSDIFNKIKSFTETVQDSLSLDNFDFDLDFSDVFRNDCNTGAIACGPPIVEFLGGGGSGASGNAIINTLGQIIGVDITNPGVNYRSSPFVKFVDRCGNGRGAVARAIIGQVLINNPSTSPSPISQNIETTQISPISQTTTTGIVNIIIEEPGEGYLQVPDGSFGGNGLTIIPKQSSTKPIATEFPIKTTGEYPVIMKLCEIIIDDGGFNYSDSDTILITPANGAIAKPFFTSSGSIYRIDIISKGEGFKELPEITVVSQSGFNARLIPRLCSEKIEGSIVSIDKIINVVDCPGK